MEGFCTRLEEIGRVEMARDGRASGGTEMKRKRKERKRRGSRARALIVVETGSRAKTRGTCESART